MVDETSDGTSSGVKDHGLVKVHKIVTLELALDHDCVEKCTEERLCYLGVLIALVHAFVTFALCDDLPCVFDNDLVRLERTVGSYAVATISCLHNLNTNVIFASRFTSLL